MKQKKSTGGRNTDTIPDSQPGGVTPLPGRVGGPVASRTMPWSRGTARIDAGCRRTARTLSTSTRPLYRSEFRPVVRLPFASRPSSLIPPSRRSSRSLHPPHHDTSHGHMIMTGENMKTGQGLRASSGLHFLPPLPARAPCLCREQHAPRRFFHVHNSCSRVAVNLTPRRHTKDYGEFIPLILSRSFNTHASAASRSLVRTRRPNTSLLVMALSHAHTRRSSCVPRDSVRKKRDRISCVAQPVSGVWRQPRAGAKESKQTMPPSQVSSLAAALAQSLTSKPQRRARARREG